MSIHRRSFLQLGAALSLSGATGAAYAQSKDGLNVVELFTSQGCSSCPPADALMLELAKEANTIALTYPVEIWDYLGWKDTLAKPAFTKRQRSYADRVAKRQVYTPQAVINGRAHCVGSDQAAVNRLRKLGAVANQPAGRFELIKEESGFRARFSLNAGLQTPHQFVLASVCSRETVAIGRGENRGRTITYGNVVRDLRLLSTLDGIIVTHADLEASRCDSFALLAQVGTLEAPGEILAAALHSPSGIRA